MKQKPLTHVHVDELLRHTVQAGCSELRLRVGQAPQTRQCTNGSPGSRLEYEAPTALDIQQMVYAVLTDERIAEWEQHRELVCHYSAAGIGEFQVHLTRSTGTLEADFTAASGS